MSRVRWLIFALACGVSWLLYLHRYAWAVIRPEIMQENPELSSSQMGWLDSLFGATYGLGQIPGGMAGDRYGPRRALTAMIVGWSACVAALALATGFWMLAAVRALFGVAQAGAYPNLSKVTRSWFPVSVRTTVQGFVASLSGRTGGACASLIVASLLIGGLGLGWRTALFVLAGGGMLLAAVFFLLFRNTPREHPWTSEAEAKLIEEGTGPATRSPAARWQLSGPQRWTFGALLAYSFLSTFGDQLFVNWLPQYLQESKGLGKIEMGVYASLPLWGGALGGACGGLLNDRLIRRTGRRRFSRGVVGLAGKLVAGVLVGLSLLVADGRMVMVVLMVAKFFCDWSMASQWGTITDISGPSAATVFGVVNGVASIATFAAGPILGALKDAYGWDAPFLAVAGVFALSALCWLMIDCERRVVAESDSEK